MPLELPLHGVITALVTPLTAEGIADHEALREVVNFQLAHKISGLFVCGTTGLGPAMPANQRKKVSETVIQVTGKRVPVIVQVGAADPQITLDLASHAEEMGADAIASLTPFYYKPGEDAMIEYFNRLS